jgi:hypothetical protein
MPEVKEKKKQQKKNRKHQHNNNKEAAAAPVAPVAAGPVAPVAAAPPVAQALDTCSVCALSSLNANIEEDDEHPGMMYCDDCWDKKLSEEGELPSESDTEAPGECATAGMYIHSTTIVYPQYYPY